MRIGAVNYLNTKPLVYDLDRLLPQSDIVFDLPSRLADGLRANKLDVALIPSIELYQDPTYTIVSNACIGCRGAVLSVKLFSRVPMGQIQSLALDEGSRTSAVLAQILLHERFGLRPALTPLPIGQTLHDTSADAVLLIGDRAIHSPAGSFSEVWDLGDQWCQQFDLPFVFAMWVARPTVDLDRIEPALGKARDSGLSHLDEIAAREAAPLGLTVPQCLSYLRDNLHFRLGAREREGLNRFFQYASELGIPAEAVSGGVNVGLDDCTTA